jgi:branched-chain amino acid transport system permease protein
MKPSAISFARRIPWTLVVFVLALTIPWVGSRYDTFLATQIAISALFAVSLNLLLGTTGLVSFGHVAYFGIGSYVCGILMKTYAMPFMIALPAAALGSAFGALVFGFFCVRLTKIYFAMLTLAFSQIIWAICFKWNDVTGGDQGLPDVPYPDLGWMSSVPFLGDLRISDQFYVLTLIVVLLSLAAMQRIINSPFGLMLKTIRENPERAASIGLDVRRYELAAFVVAGAFAGIAGALFGIFNRGVFADYVYWPKSAEVMIMTILGGIDYFWGPVVGAATLVLLNQETTSYTEYWPFVLGTMLLVLLFAFPGGIAGGVAAAVAWLRRRRGGGARPDLRHGTRTLVPAHQYFSETHGARQCAGCASRPSRPGTELLVPRQSTLSRRGRGAARLDRSHPSGCHDRRHPFLRQPEAAGARHRTGERSQDPPARRADRRHVGQRNA